MPESLSQSSSISLAEFAARWRRVTLTEKSGAQSHFVELCQALGHPTPAQADPAGTWYTFEKGVQKSDGRRGWADVWKRDYFAWEYKGPEHDLQAAYDQLLRYRDDLENPPFLVVSDFQNFRVHTNFTNTVKRIYQFTLDDLLIGRPTEKCKVPPLDVLRSVFTTPDYLHPKRSTIRVTEEAAEKFAGLATSLRKRGVPAQPAAHFLMRLLFCLFAEDIGLLPNRLFTQLVEYTRMRPLTFAQRLQKLFAVMATGGEYGNDDIRCFDGGLFTDDSVFELDAADLVALDEACQLDWSCVEPAVFGTLFERSLDPANRTKLGAHYTSREDILLITTPVLMQPLYRRWEAVRAQALDLIEQRGKALSSAKQRYNLKINRLLMDFTDELVTIRVLDPACGSGNFGSLRNSVGPLT